MTEYKERGLENKSKYIQSPKESSYSIITSSNNDTETNGDVLEKIRTAVDASKTGTKIDRVRKVKDQKVVIGCNESEEINKLTQRLREVDPTLKVVKIENKDPQIVLKDVLSINSNEDIEKAFSKLNKQLWEGLAKGEFRAVIKYRRKAKKQHLQHVVLQVLPQVRSRATNAGRLYIDMQRVHIMDQSPLIQCTRCLGYGHNKKVCTETEDACAHCGGKHVKADCPQWNDRGNTVPTCINCL